MDDVLNHAPCGFVSFADDGTVRAINDTLLHLLGHAREVVEGRHISLLLTVGSRIFYQTHLFPLLKMRGSVDEIYVSLLSQNGDEVPVLLNALRRQHAGADANDCIVIPMRQRDRYEDELLDARKAAEEAVREKDHAYAALAEAHMALEEVNVALQAQADVLQIQQTNLLELNAELYEQAKRETLLKRIGQSLRVLGNAASATILDEGVALLVETLGADRCYFTEYSPNGIRIRIAADWRRADLTPMTGNNPMLQFHRDVAQLYSSDGLFIVPDFRDAEFVRPGSISADAADAARALGLRSLVGVALFADGVLTASLSVAMADAARIWTTQEIELVQAVAALTRLAVDEARLREQSLRIAEQLQGALQPASPKDISGLKLSAYYQPALAEASVGGDFYDVFPLENNGYVLVVADLSGKGLKAAAQVATVRHMLRTLLYDPRMTLSQAVTTLSDLLVTHALIEGFATLFVGTWDANKRALRYVNAGQEPGLLYQSGSGQVLRLDPTGPVLGGYPGAIFRETEVALASGDVLALFTDGLTEAGIDRRSQLEIEGVESIFARSVRGTRGTVDDIVKRTIAGVTASATLAGIQDDVCLLIARVE